MGPRENLESAESSLLTPFQAQSFQANQDGQLVRMIFKIESLPSGFKGALLATDQITDLPEI